MSTVTKPMLLDETGQVIAEALVTMASNIGYITGADGQDGLTTSITVNGETFEQEDGDIDIGNVVRDVSNKADVSALALTDKKLGYLSELTRGNAWNVEIGTTPAYQQTIPQGAKGAAVNQVGGKSLFFNQLVGNGNFISTDSWAAAVSRGTLDAENNILTYTITTLGSDIYSNRIMNSSVNITNGHKYYVCAMVKADFASRISIGLVTDAGSGLVSFWENEWFSYADIKTATAETSTGISVCVDCATGANVGDRYYLQNVMVIDLTQMFGTGYEPATVEEFKAVLPNDYYAYNAGQLISAEVTEIESRNSNLILLSSLAIPSEIRALEGYGQSHGNERNYLDLAGKKYVEVGHYVNGTWTTHAQEIDVSAYLGDDNLLTVEDGGTVTFVQNGTSLPVPNALEYYVQQSGGTWGSITGTLADQTDLQAALDGKLDRPTIATELPGSGHTLAVNTQYFLGTQSAVNIAMPIDAEVGQEIKVFFKSGATACTLTCHLRGFDFLPKANMSCLLTFRLVHKADAEVTGDEDEWTVQIEEG